MINSYISLITILLITSRSCSAPISEANINLKPAIVTNADQEFAGIYQPLDGTWKGTFTIYEDKRGQPEKRIDDEKVNTELLESLPLAEIDRISVIQKYHSESPFYQTVEIEDTYLKNGEEERVISHGANKIEHGVMWCVVQKPDERIVHRGAAEGLHTIVWGRNLRDPLNIEFFRETVLENTYEIVGYGYYGADDPTRAPKTWFHGNYQKQ